MPVALIELAGEVIEWRGPAPYHFVAAPPGAAARLHALAPSVTYGWGMIPVTASIGEVTWTTSLWPKDGGYLLPLKDKARRAAGVELGDDVVVLLQVDGEEPDHRAALVALVQRVLAAEAVSEDQEEAWLAEFADRVPHPRAIDLVLFSEVELGDGATAEDIVDAALGYRG